MAWRAASACSARPGSCARRRGSRCWRCCARQEFNAMIPARLPPEAKVAHKTGEISTVCHDAGIVFLPGRQPYVARHPDRMARRRSKSGTAAWRRFRAPFTSISARQGRGANERAGAVEGRRWACPSRGLRALLRPGEMARDRQGRAHRLPRFFFEVPTWEEAKEPHDHAAFHLRGIAHRGLPGGGRAAEYLPPLHSLRRRPPGAMPGAPAGSAWRRPSSSR